MNQYFGSKSRLVPVVMVPCMLFVVSVDPAGAQDKEVKPTPNGDKPVHSLVGHKDRVTSVAYSPDGRWIATAAWDGTARIWDAKTRQEVRRLDVPPTEIYNPAYLSQILFSPDSEFAVIAQKSPSVIVWNHRTGERVRDFPGFCAAIAPDGKHIACSGWGQPNPYRAAIRLYEFATGKLVREMRGQVPGFESLAFSPDGKTLVSEGRVNRPRRGESEEQRLRDLSGLVSVWDVATGEERQTGLKAVKGTHIALARGGRTIAAMGVAGSKSISLWETATSGRRTELTGHAGGTMCVAFSPDGRTLASGSMDGTVRLWDLPSGKELARLGKEVSEFTGHSWVLSVAFSPDGRSLVSGGLDKKAHIWDVSKITRRPRTSAERSPAELEADWKDLVGDAVKAYAALGRLISSPKQAVSFLGKHLQSAKPPDTKRIERLIGNLDDNDFRVREQATKELGALGDRAAPSLRKALAGNPSLEVRRRLRELLGRIESTGPSAETVGEVRAVEALEAIGTPEAQEVLKSLAKGAPEARLTQEAKASLERLANRPHRGL